MQNSKFQFSKPSLLSLEFKMTDQAYDAETFSVTMSNAFNINVAKKDDGKSAFVTLSIKVDLDNQASLADVVTPFVLNAQMGALFTWEDSLTDMELDNLLSINAPALLLSYARPIVTYIVGSSILPPYYIPFINFHE